MIEAVTLNLSKLARGSVTLSLSKGDGTIVTTAKPLSVLPASA